MRLDWDKDIVKTCKNNLENLGYIDLENLNLIDTYNKFLIGNLDDDSFEEISFNDKEILKIIKEEDVFRVEFQTKKYVDGYEKEYNLDGYIGIRFRNSGSRYEPFNTVFMEMLNKMQMVDDVLDENHQIHIEEYIYSENHSQKTLRKR